MASPTHTELREAVYMACERTKRRLLYACLAFGLVHVLIVLLVR